MNLDPRSVQLNTELGVVCVSPALAAQVAGAILPNLGAHRVAARRGGRPGTGPPA